MARHENPLRGALVAIEGIDGVGKSSVKVELPAMLVGCLVDVSVTGEKRSPFRPLLEDDVLVGLSPLVKTLAFAADRAWTYEVEALPALERGNLVLWDRYVASALIYRQIEVTRGVSKVDLDYVRSVNSPFPRPDLTVLLVADTRACLSRTAARTRVYSEEFLAAAAQAYRALAQESGWVIVDAECPAREVAANVAVALRSRLPSIFR